MRGDVTDGPRLGRPDSFNPDFIKTYDVVSVKQEDEQRIVNATGGEPDD